MSSDIRTLLNTIDLVESSQIDEINWRKSLAAGAAASALMSPIGAAANQTDTGSTQYPVASTKVMGGWYPVFFDKYSVSKIDEIVDKYNSGNIKQIRILYDDNYELAQRISKNLSVLTGENISPIHSPNIDTEQTQYNHEQVVVEIH